MDTVFCEHTMRKKEVSEFLSNHILKIYEKYYSGKWDVVKSISTNGFTIKFYAKENHLIPG